MKKPTVKFLKNSDTRKNYYSYPKILTKWLYDGVMCPKDAGGMANSVDTVYPDLSVRKLRSITADMIETTIKGLEF